MIYAFVQARSYSLFRSREHRFFRTTLSASGAVLLLIIVLLKAMHWQAIRDRIRRVNRQRLNPVLLHLANSRFHWLASLQHVGRSSGCSYQTPVVA